MLDGACWGTGEWAFGPPDAPSSPYVFLALPAATELFDGERVYLIVSSAGGSQLIYKHCMSGDVGGVVVDIGEYVGTWRAIVERLRSP